MKPGSVRTNPFGQNDEQAQMHPGYGNPNAIRPTGPVDPDVSVVSVQTGDGRPLALISNYSMHYVGATDISADYFGVFCEEIGKLIGTEHSPQPFVAMLSNGTSGDAWCLDHSKPKRKFDRFSVAKDVAQAAFEAYQTIRYFDWVPLVMEEQLLTVDVRMPTDEEVTEAKAILAEVASREDDKPSTGVKLLSEIYAGETVALNEMPPTRELKLQAIRIGDLGITAMPNEVFSSTGLAIKKQSPLPATFNISLANGGEGYIPPPDQHALGGYTTWRARSSCLEIEAEPKIAAVVMQLLHKVASKRSDEQPILSTLSKRLLDSPTEDKPQTVPSPLGARESLDDFHLHEDFRIELVAAESLRNRSAKLLADSVNPDRQKVLDQWQSALTLKAQDGKDHVLLRDTLEEMQCTGKSMMPDGMEKDFTRQELGDLITYLSGPRIQDADSGKRSHD
ncbi:MAG: hypothetical protein ACR2NM_00050 [Bythopirellula sp.]